MFKILKAVCFSSSFLMLTAYALALYAAALLPDSFTVPENTAVQLADMPYISVQQTNGEAMSADASTGTSYNTQLSLGGIIPVKTVRAQVVSRRVVRVCGTPFGIKMFASGAMVVGFSDIYTDAGYQNPARTAGLKLGDVIKSIGGVSTRTNEDVTKALQKVGGNPTEIVYVRNGSEKSTRLTAVLDTSNDMWRTGMWVRDSSAGIGTLTFVDTSSGIFAGLGHSIHDVDTGTSIELRSGEIVDVEITDAVTGTAGSPGELKGTFLSNVPTGTILLNSETGVYGRAISSFSGVDLPVAFSQEVETGKAQIMCTINGREPQNFEVQIEKIALNSDNPNRNMIIRVTDEKLLAATGGIVQGMSGSPIIQNGRLIGAVTHVLVNDPTRGYAIFAENMIEAATIYSKMTA